MKKLKTDLASAGYNTWFDEDDLLVARPIASEIVKGILQSDAFILCWSAVASRSPWVADEVLRALHRRASSQQNYLVFVLRRDNTPVPAGLSEFKWVRVASGRDYSKALTAILRSLDEHFAPPAATLSKGRSIRRPRTTLQEAPEEATLTLWDLHGRGLAGNFSDYGGGHGASFSATGLLVTGMAASMDDDPDDHDVAVWKVPELVKVRGGRLFGGQEYPWCVQCHPSSDLIAVTGGSHGGRLEILDRRLKPVIAAHKYPSLSTCWVGTDMVAVASGGVSNEAIVLLSASSGSIIRRISSPPMHICSLTSDTAGQYVAVSGGDYSGSPGVCVCSVRTGTVVGVFGEHGFIEASAISPEGDVVAWAQGDRCISLADVRTGKILRTEWAHARRISHMAFNKAGSMLATGCSGGFVVVWELESFKKLAKFKVSNGVNAMAFSRDGNWLAVASEDPHCEIIE